MSNVVVSPNEGLRPLHNIDHSVIRESGSVKDIIYITAAVDGQQEFSVSDDHHDGAYKMVLNDNNKGCWVNEGQAGGAIAKTRNHKSKNRMTKKHINGKKRGTRVKSMR